MADYKESLISGKKWQRCNRIQIENPYNGSKYINMVEEEIADIGDGIMVNTPKGNIIEPFADPAAVVNLINPETGESLGSTVTYQDIYVILHSLYIQLATQRDAAQ